MIRNRVKQPEDLKAFDLDGYGFRDDLSTDEKFVFTRAVS